MPRTMEQNHFNLDQVTQSILLFLNPEWVFAILTMMLSFTKKKTMMLSYFLDFTSGVVNQI